MNQRKKNKFQARPSIAYASKKNTQNQTSNVLNYLNYETVKVNKVNKKYYQEQDQTFIKDIRNIKKVRANAILNILNINKSELSDKDCNQLDFRARIHGRANTINQNTKTTWDQIQKEDRCQCGCGRAQGDSMPMFSDEQRFNILGPGILLLFFFLKSMAALLFILSAIYSVFGIVTNLIGTRAVVQPNCLDQKYCSFKRFVSDENKNFTNLYQVQHWLGLAMCILLIIGLRIIKVLGKQKNRIIDKKLKSASDFAILIRNLPRGNYQQKQLIQYFERFWQSHVNISKQENKQKEKIFDQSIKKNSFKIKSIQIIYNMQFSRRLSENIFSLASQLDSYLVLKEQIGKDRNLIQKIQYYRESKNKIIETYQLLLDLRKKFLYDSEFRKNLSTTCCLLQFRSQKTKQFILSKFETERVGLLKSIQTKVKNLFFKSNRDVIFKKNVISIQRAPQPSDIMWQNCQKPYSLSRKLLIFAATFFIILISFGIIIGIKYLQDYLKKNPNSSSQILTVINIAISVVILIINNLLWFSLDYLLNLQYNHTLTDKTVSQMNKAIFLNSINSILVPILTNFLLIKNNFVYGNTGLSGFIFDYQVTAIVQLLPRLFNPLTVIKKIIVNVNFIRNKFIRFICSNPQLINFKKGYPQLNKFYQGQTFDIAENYVHIISAVLQAAFFFHLQPIVMVLIAINFLLFYFVNKIKLVKLCKIPQMTEYLVFDTAIWTVGLIPIFYGVGTISISYLLTNDDGAYPYMIIPPLISIGLGTFALMNPRNIFGRFVLFILSKFDLGQLLGEYQDDDVQQVQTDVDEQITKNQQLNKIKSSNNRVQCYYQKSFQKIFRGQDQKQVKRQLKAFCESFFPKTNTNNIKVIDHLMGKQITQLNKKIKSYEPYQNSQHQLKIEAKNEEGKQDFVKINSEIVHKIQDQIGK